MKQRIKDMWIEALTSGEYKQGRGALHKGDKFCCLGVLCDLAIKDGVQLDTKLDPSGYTIYDTHGWSLPSAVSDWSGLNSWDPTILENSLSTLNDGDGFDACELKPIPSMDFNAIAFLVEGLL